ncbi:MAG: Crp/Fnr family transcriptional regulator [Bacteroidaceae bacterium]|nr:Crp/Fnr family transcriptional regulator [Bacteroidaceae bacterium]
MVNDYALLTRLPLLQGISSTELLHLEDVLRLDIDELPASRLPLIRQGDNCTQLHWLVEGELVREHHSADGIYATRSSISAPAVLDVERLFGLHPTYQYSYQAKTDVKMLSIRKSLINSHLMKSEVFRLNLLNALSAISQKRVEALLPCQLLTTEERLKHFLSKLFPDSKGEVEVIIKMKELAKFIGDSRLITSRLLNRWEEEGSICLGRGHFIIPDIQALLK